tara:strand:- start:3995 stop:4675 length:681 start_codon:yes stop_codon:yes gene_type:complete
MKRIFILCILIISGCASNPSAQLENPFIKFYNQEYDGILPKTDEVEIIQVESYEDPKNWELLGQGYQQIGYSSFIGGKRNPELAIEHAKNIGATIVVYYAEFESDNPSSVTLSSGHTYYLDNARYSQEAVYLIKENIHDLKHGLYWDVMTVNEKQQYQTNFGLKINQVINNFPAFDAGVIPGDVVLQVDGIKMITLEDAEKIDYTKSPNIMKILRLGSIIELEINH